MSRDLEVLRAIAREASVLVMQVYATDFKVDYKIADDPVTRADKEANALIIEALAKHFPDAGICAEESAPVDQAALNAITEKQRVFFVDPVDGTREFASKSGEFCVMIGMAVDGSPSAGVVAIPIENKLIWGSLEEGTYCEPLDGQGEAKRMVIGAPQPALRAVVSRSHPSPRTQAILQKLEVAQQVPCGSVGVKAARVIEGVADLYVHPSNGAKLWDACAPEALIKSAGGVMTNIDGNAIDYRGVLGVERGLIATSRQLLPRVLAAIGVEPTPSSKG
jgi:3'(2'), 5'-bisphosphate nucleotidase